MDTREQCNGCTFFRGSDYSPKSYKFCHHLLYTNKRRQIGENNLCLSRNTEIYIPIKKPFSLHYNPYYEE